MMNSPVKIENAPSVNGNGPIFDMNVNNFQNFQSPNNDASSFLGNPVGVPDQNSQLVLQNLKTDTNAFMEMEVLDFTLADLKQAQFEDESYTLPSMHNMIQHISMPPPKAKAQVKPIAKDKYAYPKKNQNANK